MTYQATYEASDTSLVIVDLIVTVFVAIVSFGTLIGLVLLYRWFQGKKIKIL